MLRRRRTKVSSNYLDLFQLSEYWSPARFNHHTAPTSMVYGFREALRAVAVEGLPQDATRGIAGTVTRSGPAWRPSACACSGRPTTRIGCPC